MQMMSESAQREGDNARRVIETGMNLPELAEKKREYLICKPQDDSLEIRPADHIISRSGPSLLTLIQHKRNAQTCAAHRPLAFRAAAPVKHPRGYSANLYLVRSCVCILALSESVARGRGGLLGCECGFASDDTPAIVVRLDERHFLTETEQKLVREERRE